MKDTVWIIGQILLTFVLKRAYSHRTPVQLFELQEKLFENNRDSGGPTNKILYPDS